jgi:short-chain fatty acids transporter
MQRVIRVIASWPRTPKSAVALVTFFSLATSWFNWGFSLIFAAMLALEVARRVEGVDIRALAAASFLGAGSIWAQGLSGSAALMMATPGALQPQIRDIVSRGGLVPGGLIPFRHTIFLWQSFASVAIEIAVVTTVMWFATPWEVRSQKLEVRRSDAPSNPESRIPNPGQYLEHSSLLMWLTVALGAWYLVRSFAAAADPLNAITLNTLNLAFLLLGFLLHRTPARLMAAFRSATPAVWGVLLQFPFYAGIAGIIITTRLSDRLAAAFVHLSSRGTFPPIVAIYSAVLGVFVPSGGSKWVIIAPYVMEAAHTMKVHLGWCVSAYDLGEAVANLIQPFFMLPILGLFGLSARDVMGYTMVVFLVLTPVVIALVWLLGLTLSYPL